MTFQHETISSSTIATPQKKALRHSGSFVPTVTGIFRRLVASFWRHSDSMGKTNTTSFDGLL